MTIIAFIGSVFSPYYAASRRQGPANPYEHCAVNIALYGRGARRWGMTERGSQSVTQDKDGLQIGTSTLSWTGNAFVIEIDEATSLGAAKLKGRVVMEPSITTEFRQAVDGAARHFWQPIAPEVRVSVAMDSPALSWSGSGYFDMNYGSEPLEDGFDIWNWSRVNSSRDTSIIYDLTRKDGSALSLALGIARDGTVSEKEAPFVRGMPRTAIWQMPRHTLCDKPDACPAVYRTLEDTPFYSRSAIQTPINGETAFGMHESLSLKRFNTKWVQTLLPYRMPRRP